MRVARIVQAKGFKGCEANRSDEMRGRLAGRAAQKRGGFMTCASAARWCRRSRHLLRVTYIAHATSRRKGIASLARLALRRRDAR